MINLFWVGVEWLKCCSLEVSSFKLKVEVGSLKFKYIDWLVLNWNPVESLNQVLIAYTDQASLSGWDGSTLSSTAVTSLFIWPRTISSFPLLTFIVMLPFFIVSSPPPVGVRRRPRVRSSPVASFPLSRRRGSLSSQVLSRSRFARSVSLAYLYVKFPAHHLFPI